MAEGKQVSLPATCGEDRPDPEGSQPSAAPLASEGVTLSLPRTPFLGRLLLVRFLAAAR